MSEQGWQTVTNKKIKKVKAPEPVKFDPIPSRQRETLNQIKAQEDAKKQIHYSDQVNNTQDWKTVTLTKTQPKPKPVFTQKPASAIKLDNTDEVVKIKRVSAQMAKAVVDARIAKKWSQVQLAHNACIDVKTINEIEKPGTMYNADTFNKVAKALGVKIERNYDLS